jgi:hypothetical protein
MVQTYIVGVGDPATQSRSSYEDSSRLVVGTHWRPSHPSRRSMCYLLLVTLEACRERSWRSQLVFSSEAHQERLHTS